MIGTVAFAIVAFAPQSQDIDSYVQKAFKDATLSAKATFFSQKELAKINDDFGKSYRLANDNTQIRVKEPFKLRIDAKVEDTKILFVVNGTNQLIRIPGRNINVRQNLAKTPGRRQTLLDFGIITPSLFTDFFEAKFVRVDRATGDVVFDVTYPKVLDDTSRHRIWIDTEKKFVTKREWYNQPGRQLATFYYTDPQNFSGVWLPTKMQVKNVDGVLAGETRYSGLKVNSGLDETLFATK